MKPFSIFSQLTTYRKYLINLLVIICITVVTSSCNKQSQFIDLTPVNDSMIGKIKSRVILGNSIVRHGPLPSIGWYGDWGMAASSKDSDFVHILIRELQAKDNRIIVKFKNITDFETNFVSFNLSTIDSMKNADLIVMKISENVDPNGPNYPQFIAYYNQLISYLDPTNKAVKVIVDGYWEKLINDKIRNYALDKKYPLITITDLSQTNANKGFADHPSDQGMRLIARRIWNYIRLYF